VMSDRGMASCVKIHRFKQSLPTGLPAPSRRSFLQ